MIYGNFIVTLAFPFLCRLLKIATNDFLAHPEYAMGVPFDKLSVLELIVHCKLTLDPNPEKQSNTFSKMFLNFFTNDAC